jgi:hypothetical protein
MLFMRPSIMWPRRRRWPTNSPSYTTPQSRSLEGGRRPAITGKQGSTMGLDGTIKRPDGNPLGSLTTVQEALAAAFPGIVVGPLPSGAEQIRAADAQGIVFPDVIRQHLASTPAKQGAEYIGPEFSAQFNLGTGDIVQQVDVVLYGATATSEPMFALLERDFGWITTHP